MTSLLDLHGVEIAGRMRPTDLSVPAGQLVAVIGPNGGGKTGLLRACAAIDCDGGRIRISGEDLRNERRVVIDSWRRTTDTSDRGGHVDQDPVIAQQKLRDSNGKIDIRRLREAEC